MEKTNNFSFVAILSLICLDFFVWYQVLFGAQVREPQAHFFDVGEGDAELFILPGGVAILTDSGPDAGISRKLEAALPATRRYIDLAIISHPQFDHFGGMNDLLRRYEFGAILVNGREADTESADEWRAFREAVRAKRIPLIVVAAGDRIRYRNNAIDFLSPNRLALQSAELNDTSLVSFVNAPPLRMLLTADIGFSIERYITKTFDLRADILKVGHHGSKYASSNEFLAAVDPFLAVITAGSRNRYGHPTVEVLNRLASSTQAKVLRTDENGTIRIIAEGKKLKVYTER